MLSFLLFVCCPSAAIAALIGIALSARRSARAGGPPSRRRLVRAGLVGGVVGGALPGLVLASIPAGLAIVVVWGGGVGAAIGALLGALWRRG